jgi:hypothetical protein
MWKITDEQRFGVVDKPDSFERDATVRSIRQSLLDLMKVIDENYESEANSIISSIDKELSDVDSLFNEFEEWGEHWAHIAQDLDCNIKNSLSTIEADNCVKNVPGKILVDYPSKSGLNFGNFNFKNFIARLLPNAVFSIEDNYPEQIVLTGKGYSTGLGFVKDGVCRYKNFPLIIDFITLKAILNGNSYDLQDYFKDWMKPTMEEYDYFKMITDGHYWVRELYKESEVYVND